MGTVYLSEAVKGIDIETKSLTTTENEAIELEDTAWDDLRVSVNATTVNGSNPPTPALFKNDGTAITGDAYALSFLSTTQGNLNLPDDVVFDTSSDFTFSFWLRPVVGTQNNIECMRKNGAFDMDFTGVDQLQLDVSGVGSILSTVAFNRGAWNWITIIHDTTEVETRFYVNNILGGSLTGVMSDTSNIFQYNRSETLYDVDYIEYWDVVKTPAELGLRYASGAGLQLVGNEVGLKGLWELNDGAGTVVVEKTGIATNGSISGGSEGTQWDWIVGHVGNSTPNTRGTIVQYFSPDVQNELYFEVQVPHSKKYDTDLDAHIHWIANADGATGEFPRWGLEYTWCNIGDVFSDTTVIYSNTVSFPPDTALVKNKHYISELGDIDGTGMTLSSMLVCRVFRDADSVDDDYTNFAGLLEIDFHYQIDTLGSKDEYVK